MKKIKENLIGKVIYRNNLEIGDIFQYEYNVISEKGIMILKFEEYIIENYVKYKCIVITHHIEGNSGIEYNETGKTSHFNLDKGPITLLHRDDE